MPDRRPATTRRAFLRGAGGGGGARRRPGPIEPGWRRPGALVPDQCLDGCSARTASPAVRRRPQAGFSRGVDAHTRAYTDAQSGIEVSTQHAEVDGLSPRTNYYYDVPHDGAAPGAGNFSERALQPAAGRTAPAALPPVISPDRVNTRARPIWLPLPSDAACRITARSTPTCVACGTRSRPVRCASSR